MRKWTLLLSLTLVLGATFPAAADRVPDGTEILIRLDDDLSSRTARREDRIHGTVVDPVDVDGAVAIPAGTEVRGTVRDVEPAERPARGGRLELSFDTLVLDGGRSVALPARVVRVAENKVDKSKAGLGAIVGGIVGAVVDGKKGALIGAIVGGGGAVVALKGDDVELPAGTILALRLQRSVEVAGR